MSRQRAPIPPQLKEQQLTTNSSENAVTSGRISPDGRYLAYSDLKGVHLKLIATGESQTLALPESQKGTPLQWSVNSWFPDSVRFLASTSLPLGVGDLWVFSVMGGAPRKIRENAWGWSVSPDGSFITFSTKLRRYGYSDVWVMDAKGEQARQVQEAGEKSELANVQWSADGLRQAYVRSQAAPGGQRYTIETRDLQGSAPNVVYAVVGEFLNLGFEWLHNGRLVFSQEEQDNCSLWTVRLNPKTGQAPAPAEPLTQTKLTDFCAEGLSASADGKRLALQKIRWQTSVYVGDIGPNGLLLKAPNRLTLSESRDLPVDWTADSGAVLFTSDRNGHAQIFKQSLDSDTPELIEVGAHDPSLCCVSPDGQWILFATTQDWEAENWELRRVPIGGGASESVLTGHYGADAGVRCSKSPATLCVVGEYSSDRKQLTFTAFDPLKGRGQEILRYDADPAGRYSWNLSKDGTRIAVMNPREGRIHILHLNGQPPEQIEAIDLKLGDALDWGKDNSGVLIDNATARGTALTFLDLKGKSHAIYEVPGSRVALYDTAPWGIVSPDGRRLAINVYSTSGNVWMLEDF
jgi:Tol biopolymer transport system component